ENTMHRAVLLAKGKEIGAEAIMLSGRPAAAAKSGNGNGHGVGQSAGQSAGHDDGHGDGHGDGRPTQGLVGQTVADVERDLIIDTLQHCLGNRTHAANILGISIRTLRNKLRQYSIEGHDVPSPGDGNDRPAA
ncbi:MAG: helix-turn-helix domain-containing protein, partial [Rhodospirillales bacterium]